MNYSVFKLTESDNCYFFYFLSPFDGNDIELVAENIEHYIANVPNQMNQYLLTVDFDNVKIEKVDIPAITVLNKTFQPDDKNMNISTSYISLIPPPKEPKKRKEKTDKVQKEAKKEAKPRSAKKQAQKVEINTSGETLSMN